MLLLLPLLFAFGTFAQPPLLPGLPGLPTDFNPATISYIAPTQVILSRFNTFASHFLQDAAFTKVSEAMGPRSDLLSSVLDSDELFQPGHTMTTESWYKAMPTEFHSWISSVISEEVRLMTDTNDLPGPSTSRANRQASSSTSADSGSMPTMTGSSKTGSGTSGGGTAASTTTSGAETNSSGATKTATKANSADVEQFGRLKGAQIAAAGVAAFLGGALLL